MIDQQTIQRIFDTVDIVEVIGEFVSLKRAGQNYKGLSPFTNEKTPSFIVSPAKGIFKCFSSGKGGNAVTFLMEQEKLSYPEALRFLAKKYNIEIVEKERTSEEIHQQNEREGLLVLTAFAQKTFTRNLFEEEEGQAVGLSYFKERGFRTDIIKKFQLGYSLEKRDDFTQYAQKQGYKLDYLVKTGLSIKKNDYAFDRFSNRVMFPIHSLSGKVIGFGGRILKSDPKAAKYLNSPESEIYHKSHTLYGVFYAKSQITKNDKCYLVEGYTDVISMHQAGIENVVASSGTALTVEQIRLIKRFTPNITIIFDGDEAGIKASLRGIDLVLEEGMNVKVMLLPKDEDPDSFAQKHSREEFLDFIAANETDFITFKTKLLLGDAQNDPVKKAGLITDIVRSISVIPSGITRTVYIRECSKMMDIDEKVLITETNKFRRKKIEDNYKKDRYQKARQTQEREQQGQAEVPDQAVLPEYDDINERELIRLLLAYGNNELYRFRDQELMEERSVLVKEFIVDELEKDELTFKNPVYQKIYDFYKDSVSNEASVDEAFFTQNADESVSRKTVDLLTSNYELSKIWLKNENFIETEDMKLKEIVPETIISFKSRRILEMLTDAHSKLKAIQYNDDLNNVIELQQRVMILNEIKRGLSKSLGDRIVM